MRCNRGELLRLQQDQMVTLAGIDVAPALPGIRHADVLVPAGSLLAGTSMRELRFRQRFNANVLAAKRTGATLRDRLGRLVPREGLVDRIDGREIQLGGDVQQEEHQMVRRQPLHRRGRQQQRLLRVPGAEGFGLFHAPCYRPDPLLSLRSGQVLGVCGEAGGGVMCDTLLVFSRPMPSVDAGHCPTLQNPAPRATWGL